MRAGARTTWWGMGHRHCVSVLLFVSHVRVYMMSSFEKPEREKNAGPNMASQRAKKNGKCQNPVFAQIKITTKCAMCMCMHVAVTLRRAQSSQFKVKSQHHSLLKSANLLLLTNRT